MFQKSEKYKKKIQFNLVKIFIKIGLHSKKSKRLDQGWHAGLSKGPEREYTFIASPHGWQVTNDDLSLMDVEGKKAKYAIVPGHGHNSVVNAVAKTVAEIVIGK